MRSLDERVESRARAVRVPPLGAVWLVLTLVAAAGWLVRAAPVLRAGAFAAGSDYDDAVNFSAASLLLHGVFPYRDFFYAHPPGGLLVLAPLAALGRVVGVDRGFWIGGFVVTAVGAVNIVLVGRLGWRAWGPVAGLTSAVLYAIHPHVLVAERTTFMEPLLNLACIGMANVWLAGRGTGDRDRLTARSAWWTGVLAGVALSLKIWAAAWVVAALVAVPSERRRELVTRFAGGLLAALAVVVVPLALVGHRSFFDDVVRFHLWRPPDGTRRPERLFEILGFREGSRNLFAGPHAPTSLLALAGLGLAALRARDPERRAERLAAVAYALGALWLFTSGVYYTHYNSHLALAETTLAGLAVSAGWGGLRRRTPVAVVAGGVVCALALAAVPVSAVKAVEDARARTPENEAIGTELRALPGDACVFGFEPVWTVSAGRLPPHQSGLPIVPDPYGAMLFASVRTGARYPGVAEAFAEEASQGEIRRLLAGCDFVVLGWRGFWQLSDASESWLQSAFQPRPAGPSGLEIWERRDRR